MQINIWTEINRQADRQTSCPQIAGERERDIQADRHTRIHTDNKIKRQRDIQTYIR